MRRLARSVVVVALLAGIVAVPAAYALRFTDASYFTPEGIVGTPYSHTFAPADPSQCAPFTFTVINGALPPGLTLGASTGKVSGTPTTPGSFTFDVDLRERSTQGCTGQGAQRRFAINVIAKLTILNESASPGTVGTPYSLQLTASGGGTQTWSIQSGVLPPGLTFDPKTALLAGTPTTPGSYPFVVLVTDPKRSDTKALTIDVRDPLTAPAARYAAPGADAEVGARFGTTFKPTGGSGTHTWALTGGALPPGLVLAPTGVLAGIPSQAGSFGFQLTVTDSEGRAAVLSEAIAVAARLTIRTQLLRPGKKGRPYTTTIRYVGGIAPVRWQLTGPRPRGFSIDAETGELKGTPAKAGTYVFRVRAADAKRVVAKQKLTLTVNA